MLHVRKKKLASCIVMSDPVDARVKRITRGVGGGGWLTVYPSYLSIEQIPELVTGDLCFGPANEHTDFSCRLQELQLSIC